jgi:23S rRNA pseudouridine2605 synthase
MCDAVGHPVRTLRRIRIGPIADKNLKSGTYRELTSTEVEKLKRAGRK